MIIGNQLRCLESSKILGKKIQGFGSEWAQEWEVLPELFLELGEPIGLGKLLTCEVLGPMPQNLDMTLLWYNLRYGINFIKNPSLFDYVFRFDICNMGTKVSLAFLHTPEH